MVIVPNPDLKPEKTLNYELGVSKIFNNKTKWESAVYYTSFIDIGTVDKFTFNGKDSILYDGMMSRVYANQNKDKAFIYGVSTNTSSRFDKHFSMNLALNYTYGRIKTDSIDLPLDHIPPFMAKIGWAYTNARFQGDFFIHYNGWKKLKDYFLNGEDTMPSAVG